MDGEVLVDHRPTSISSARPEFHFCENDMELDNNLTLCHDNQDLNSVVHLRNIMSRSASCDVRNH